MNSKRLLIVVGIFLVSIGFYWLYIKPTQIRNRCADIYYAIETVGNQEIPNGPSKEEIRDRLKGSTLSNEARNNLYRRCLAAHGMKPEDLF